MGNFYQGHWRSEFLYNGSDWDAYETWVRGEISNRAFRTQTAAGDGTDALELPTGHVESGHGASKHEVGGPTTDRMVLQGGAWDNPEGWRVRSEREANAAHSETESNTSGLASGTEGSDTSDPAGSDLPQLGTTKTGDYLMLDLPTGMSGVVTIHGEGVAGANEFVTNYDGGEVQYVPQATGTKRIKLNGTPVGKVEVLAPWASLPTDSESQRGPVEGLQAGYGGETSTEVGVIVDDLPNQDAEESSSQSNSGETGGSPVETTEPSEGALLAAGVAMVVLRMLAR